MLNINVTRISVPEIRGIHEIARSALRAGKNGLHFVIPFMWDERDFMYLSDSDFTPEDHEVKEIISGFKSMVGESVIIKLLDKTITLYKEGNFPN